MKKTAYQVFPIQTETSCLLKWSWSTIFLRQGTSSSCHRTDQYPIPADNVGIFHNLPNKVRAREMMRRGEWPQEGCQYCEKIERAGGTSDRMYQLSTPGNVDMVPYELQLDSETNHVTPTTLEIYFNNTCNMSCLYCGSHFSSKWEEENRRFGVFKRGGVEFGFNQNWNPNYEQMLQDFWQYLKSDNRYRHIRQYQIAGGEPFFQDEFEQSLDFWEQNPNPELTFNMITNLKVPHKKFQNYIARFEQMVNDGAIKRLQISSSLDCWGPQQEYVRYGLDLKEWQENFEYLLDKPFVVQTINAAMSPLTIKTLPDLVSRLSAWNERKIQSSPRASQIFFSFMTVMAPHYMDPAIFGHGVFEDDFVKIIEAMPHKTQEDLNAVEHMKGIAKQISSAERDSAAIEDLKVYLTEIDRRRKSNWHDLFSWLDHVK